ncbi:MAG: carbohydrate ABC transporter permease, partial [Halanaerobium sp.]
MMPENKALKYIGNFAFILIIILIAVYILFPFYWTVNSSFKSEAQLRMMPASFLPADPDTGEISFSFINYKQVFQNKEFLIGILNS